MSGSFLGLIELIAVAGVVFILGWRELRSVQRDRRASQAKAKADTSNDGGNKPDESGPNHR